MAFVNLIKKNVWAVINSDADTGRLAIGISAEDIGTPIGWALIFTFATLWNTSKGYALKSVCFVKVCECDHSVLAVEIPGVICLKPEMDPCLILGAEME